ncbi:MAG TPA: DUF5947 family protein [Gaiellaceae bacterium]|nr:DUF5947 family protein [Gaiellaceae bacterium]
MTGSRLAELARRPRPVAPPAAEEACELCGAPVDPEHRHVLDLRERRLLCACRACSILFDRKAAGGGHYRLVPNRSRLVADFELDDLLWSRLRLPVDLAFFFRTSADGRTVAFYPSPLGATESLLELDAWAEIEAGNPVLDELEPDVEALLVNRAGEAREHWLVPVDRCYALVGLIKTRWKGLAGGQEVWEEIAEFFGALRAEADVVTKEGEEARP